MRRRSNRWVPSLLVMDIIILMSIMAWAGMVLAQDTGEAAFNSVCKACHTIGQGKLVGPDLAGVSQRRDLDWIISFVQSSQTVIKSGDEVAVKLFEENNKVTMPDNPLSRAEVMAVIRYVEATAGDPAAKSAVLPTPLETASEDDLLRGADLFQGAVRLAGGGPACNSCHHVNVAGVMGGGSLARDLTAVLARMPAPGVQGILTSPPFPAMKQAYTGHALTEDEIFALTAFLQKIDADKTVVKASSYGLAIFFSGFGGLVILLALIAMIWMNRKQDSVYKSIHERQIKTQ